jgi:tRNA1(Val) A37 N6-methylase TrmN6
MSAEPLSDSITDDAVLGGRLRLLQPRSGHRFGHDAVLLAAATRAASRDTIAELGAGVGLAGLAVAVRIPEAQVTLVESDSRLVALARENASRNALADRVRVLQADATSLQELSAGGVQVGALDHVIMNPPFNDPLRARASPDPARATAHVSAPHTLSAWVDAAGRLLRDKGTLTLIWRADALSAVLASLSPVFGGPVVLPVHSRPSAAAIRVLVRTEKGSRAPLALLPGFFLQDAGGHPSAAAERIMRDGGVLPLAL